MKHYILFLSFLVLSSLAAQTEESSLIGRNELSTDVSALINSNFRLEYNRRGNKRGAYVIGLRSRTQSATVTIDTNQLIRREDKLLRTSQAWRIIDLNVGLKSYLDNNQERGMWVQIAGLVSLAQWQTQEYKKARQQAVFPEEFNLLKRMFGLQGEVGYRYVFDNGLSLNAQVGLQALALRSEFQSERFTQGQRDTGGFDISFSGSFLTLGYVW